MLAVTFVKIFYSSTAFTAIELINVLQIKSYFSIYFLPTSRDLNIYHSNLNTYRLKTIIAGFPLVSSYNFQIRNNIIRLGYVFQTYAKIINCERMGKKGICRIFHC